MSLQSNQQLHYTFSPSGTDWWVPQRSVVRIRMRNQQRRARSHGDANQTNRNYDYGPMLPSKPCLTNGGFMGQRPLKASEVGHRGLIAGFYNPYPSGFRDASNAAWGSTQVGGVVAGVTKYSAASLIGLKGHLSHAEAFIKLMDSDATVYNDVDEWPACSSAGGYAQLFTFCAQEFPGVGGLPDATKLQELAGKMVGSGATHPTNFVKNIYTANATMLKKVVKEATAAGAVLPARTATYGGDGVAQWTLVDIKAREDAYEALPNYCFFGARQCEKTLACLLGLVRPARGFCASMFNSASVRIGDTVISKLSDDNLQQVDVFLQRSEKSAFFTNGAGNYLGLYANEDKHHKSGGNAAPETHGADERNRVFTSEFSSGNFEGLWQPPLGVFAYSKALPPSKYDFTLITRSGNPLIQAIDWENFKFNAGTYGDVPAGASKITTKVCSDRLPNSQGPMLDWRIKDVTFHATMVQGPMQDDAKYCLDLNEISVNCRELTSTDGHQCHNFDVNAQTKKMAWCIQGSINYLHGSNGEFRCGLRPANIDTKCNPNVEGQFLFDVPNLGYEAATGLIPAGAEARYVRGWSLDYDSKKFPQEFSEQEIISARGDNADGTAESTASVLMTQRWFDTQQQCGTMWLPSGGETLTQWLGGGAFYYVSWPRQGTANGTRVMLNLSFETGGYEDEKEELGHDGVNTAGESKPGPGGKLLLFTVYPKAFLISTHESRVIAVETPVNQSAAQFQSV